MFCSGAVELCSQLLHMSSARKKTAKEINLDYIAGQPNVVWPYRGGETFVEQRPCRFCRRFHGPRWHEIACECLHYTLNAHKVKCGDATLWQIERARRILGARRIGDKVDGNGFLPNCTCLGSQFQWLSSAGGKRHEEPCCNKGARGLTARYKAHWDVVSSAWL